MPPASTPLPYVSLTRRSDFQAATRHARRWSSGVVSVQVNTPKKEEGRMADDRLRLGLTASRKVGNAVCRNRAKRRLRAAMREIVRAARASGQSFTPGRHIVLVARTATVTAPFSVLRDDIERALRHMGVLPLEAPQP